MASELKRVEDARDLARMDILFAPASFRNGEIKVLAEVCNGCGAAGAKFDFVPDTIYFYYVGEACQIHDWMYHKGRTIEDKDEADRAFFNNVLRLIERSNRCWTLKFLMRRRALKYYLGVKYFGGPAFWSGKGELL